MQVYYKTYQLPFQYPFTISQGRTKTHQPTLVVALQVGKWIGYGESPAIAYYNFTVEEMVATLEQYKPMIEKYAFTEPERFWHFLHHLLPNQHFLVNALDMAGWDLYGKMNQKPLYELWQTPFTGEEPITDYTLGIDTPEKMLQKMQARPHPVYKIKIDNNNSLDTIRYLRAHTNVPFRLDANEGFTYQQFKEILPELVTLNIEFIEQPLAKTNWEEMKQLFIESPIPLIADESCVTEKDVASCAGHFHGINIKLTKCSGITPAIRMIKQAKELGLKVMMGSMNESSLGSAAIGNFLPQLDYVDMDGPLLLSEDIAKGLNYDNGKITLSGKFGLGVQMLG